MTRIVVLCLILLAWLGADPADARQPAGSLAIRFDPAPLGADLFSRPPIHAAGRYVVIRLAENRLYVMEHERVIWTAPVATGAGFRLESGDRQWHFATPSGVFRVQRKEKDPGKVDPARSPATRRMAEKLATADGKVRYAERKWIGEAVNGWVKRVLGFRQFSIRGLRGASGEWDLVCLATNLRRMQPLMVME